MVSGDVLPIEHAANEIIQRKSLLKMNFVWFSVWTIRWNDLPNWYLLLIPRS
ncbi:uncharacterized protein METZ01_LOCUS21111 [marine metagenome]|uniref:Uncharacterized protein n=1 Tax=marine metagenome TaxID=408172 RepID=A0A381PQ87_9ZZZZ